MKKIMWVIQSKGGGISFGKSVVIKFDDIHKWKKNDIQTVHLLALILDMEHNSKSMQLRLSLRLIEGLFTFRTACREKGSNVRTILIRQDNFDY